MPNLNHINHPPPAGIAWASTVEPLAVPMPRAPAATGLSRSAIYREAAKGNLRLIKAGRSTLVCLESARAFLARLPTAQLRPAAGETVR